MVEFGCHSKKHFTIFFIFMYIWTNNANYRLLFLGQIDGKLIGFLLLLLLLFYFLVSSLNSKTKKGNSLVTKEKIVKKNRNFKLRQITSGAQPTSCSKGNKASCFGFIFLHCIYITCINGYLYILNGIYTYIHTLRLTSHLEGLNSLGFG
jgi:uncharacterized membrane protein